MSFNKIIFGDNKYLFNSGETLVASGYTTIHSPNLDCSFESPFIYTNTGSNIPKILTYDSYDGSGYNIFVQYPSNPGGTIEDAGIMFTGNSYHIFRNGFLLISGRDYHFNAGFKFILNPSPQFNNDAFYFIKEASPMNYISGNITTGNGSFQLNGKPFNHGVSTLYSSGLRLTRGLDYVESSTIDLLTGKLKVSTYKNYL